MKKDIKSANESVFENLKGILADEQIKAPIQKVTPVAPTKTVVVSKKGVESPFTLYIPTKVLKNLKVKAASEGISIKDLINNAIQSHYNLNN